jgi:CheY-like chemotaxis protein
VWADSVVGKGSTFHVRLPLHSAMELGRASSLKTDGELAAALPPVRPESGHKKGKTVLVVDDEENILRALQLILEQDGHRVLIARSGEEAVETCRKARPDVVLLDVMLPDIDGFQVLARLRADPELASTPVFILSILGDRDQGMQHGAQEYFSKPIDKEKLLEAVSRLVQKTPREDVKILVVDDDPHILQAVTRHLQQRGYHNTLTAGDGLESVVRARDQHPDLIILDIYMPDMDGFEVIRQLRSRDDTCQIPIIVLTASDIPVDEIRAHSLGVQEFMNKPFSEKELARAVRQALGQVQQGRKVDEEDSGR